MQALSSSTTTALRGNTTCLFAFWIDSKLTGSSEVVTSLLQSVALFLTIFRLWYRISIRMFWWEDAWALLAFVCAIATLITEWLHMQTGKSSSLVSAWVYSLGFLAVSWTVRISVMFSIVRIVSPSQVYRRITLAAAALLLLMWILDTAQKIWNCQSSDIWYSGAGPAGKPWCRMSRAMTIFELCMVFIADALLVALPVRLLWNVKLPKGERRMILLIFSSSIVMALASFFHGTCQLVPLVPLITPAVDFEVRHSYHCQSKSLS
ncbi:hypothetical protein HYDPIDRAFT_98176 [Hydnomerulius pinastri MD-312]|uniref:Rhodopsin domain-containing protein n=1 Tax=Hydnomerulius pinastri MD-312 TaxID=994086 RepID=A0A0C9V5H6_9AGAM|nr:hypothetical protein HYDPIDRAFT_98176 [Hydnomerulius pinastri MD-312]